MDTANLEQSFQEVGNTVGQLVQQQLNATNAIQRSIDDQRDERLHGLLLLQQLNDSQYQNNFKSLFDNIPVYDGNDPDEFFPWLDALEAACFYSGRDARIEALGKSTGRVRNTILSVPQGKRLVHYEAEAPERILPFHHSSSCCRCSGQHETKACRVLETICISIQSMPQDGQWNGCKSESRPFQMDGFP